MKLCSFTFYLDGANRISQRPFATGESTCTHLHTCSECRSLCEGLVVELGRGAQTTLLRHCRGRDEGSVLWPVPRVRTP